MYSNRKNEQTETVLNCELYLVANFKKIPENWKNSILSNVTYNLQFKNVPNLQVIFISRIFFKFFYLGLKFYKFIKLDKEEGRL